jgi:hypothetical protein
MSGHGVLRRVILTLVLCVMTRAAHAQWTRVEPVPPGRVFSVWANGDTLAAGADTCVHVSTDAGVTWHASKRPAAGVTSIQAVRMLNKRLYAGTFGQGVFVSDDLGATWQNFNLGLGGVQLFVSDLLVKGDSLYAATSGAGVAVRRLSGAGAWQNFGAAFEDNEDPNVNSLGSDGSRLVAAAGGNGLVYRRDPGDSDWTLSDLDNVGLHPGIMGGQVAWTGSGWVVGTIRGVFRSTHGQEPWALFDPGLGPLQWIAFTTSGHQLVAFFTKAAPPAATFAQSGDDGATWTLEETLPGVLVTQLAFSRGTLYAARLDGLFRRTPVASAAPGVAPAGLRFAVAGAQPVTDRARLRFELAQPASLTLDLFDAAGRRVIDSVRGAWPAGPGEWTLDMHGLAPGVYSARLHTGARSESVRLAHIR